MKIFSAAQLRKLDAETIRLSGGSSLDLMEQAAAACADWIAARYPAGSLFVVFCGPGNNGGDGLALSRLLLRRGFGLKAFLLDTGGQRPADCQANLDRLRQMDAGQPQILKPGDWVSNLPEGVVIIDAILGTGLNRPAGGWLATVIHAINRMPYEKISIDMPSGLPADELLPQGSAIIQATHTLSFECYKRAMLHPEHGDAAGRVHVLDIGLNDQLRTQMHSSYHTFDAATAACMLRPRSAHAHKGTLGTALLIGGSRGMIGAAMLATRAAGRAGAGKVRSLVPGCGYGPLQTAVPEAMCKTSGSDFIESIEGWESAKGIGIGMGMGQEPQSLAAFEKFLSDCMQPIVIDADALNLLGQHPALLSQVPAGSVLTPHPKEFERMFGQTAHSMAALELARSMAMRHNICIIYKGRYTAVVLPGGACWYNLSGHPALATGGSGDVLSGIITGLLAQGYEPVQAALLGVHLHGLAAGAAMERQSPESLVAGDITEYLGMAFKKVAAGSL